MGRSKFYYYRVPQLLTPLLINEFDSTFINDGGTITVTSNNPLTLYPLGSAYTFFASTSNLIQNNFNTTKFITIPPNVDTRSYDIIEIYDNSDDNIIPNDVFNAFAGGGGLLTTTKSLLLGCLNYDGTRQIAVSYCDTNTIFPIINGTALPSTTEITFGINTTLNKIYLMSGNAILQEETIPPNLFDTNTLTLAVGGAAGSFLGSNGFTIVVSPSINHIEELRDSLVVVPPVGATDGSLWEVTSDGIYNNNSIKQGDYVIFHNNLTEIIILPNLNAELNTITSQIVNINTQITGNLLDITKQVILNGIIDDCGNTPTSTLTGSVFLAYNNPSAGLTAFRLHVYANSQWNLLDIPNGAEFTLANTGVKIRHKAVSFAGIKTQFQTYTVNTTILERLNLIINDENNYRWELVLDSHYKDNCFMHIGNAGEGIVFNTNLYDSLHVYLDDTNSDTYNEPVIYFEDDGDNCLRKLTTYRICIENRKSYDIKVYFNSATAGLLLPVYPLSSTIITVPKNSILNLHYRPILNNENSMYKLIEYVSGVYKNTYYYVNSDLAENVNNPSKVIVNYTTGGTFTFSVESLYLVDNMCIEVILKNNFGSPVSFNFINGGVIINQAEQLGIYTLMYNTGSWSVL